MCRTWQRVIHHCCSGVWGAAAVVQGLHKYQLLFWREQTGSRGVHLQWEQKVRLRTGFLTELVPCECLLVARFSAVPLAWRLSSRNHGFALYNMPGSAHHSLCHSLASAGSELTSLLFPHSSYFHLEPCTEPLWCGKLFSGTDPGFCCEEWRNCLEISLGIIWSFGKKANAAFYLLPGFNLKGTSSQLLPGKASWTNFPHWVSPLKWDPVYLSHELFCFHVMLVGHLPQEIWQYSLSDWHMENVGKPLPWLYVITHQKEVSAVSVKLKDF